MIQSILSFQSDCNLWCNKIKDGWQGKLHAWGKCLGTVDVGALDLHSCPAALKPPPPLNPQDPMLPPPHSQMPSRGRDGGAFSGQLPVECRKQFDMGIRQHGEKSECTSTDSTSLSLALPSRIKHQLLQRRSIIWMSHYLTVEAWNVLKIKVFLLLCVLAHVWDQHTIQ